jgi:hypothetical protein
MHLSDRAAPGDGQSPSLREKVLVIVRIGLGSGQMMGAVTTAVLLLETGLSLATQIAFTFTTVLLCASLLLKYLGCWETKKPV